MSNNIVSRLHTEGSDPVITLKKGKVELKIKNASTIIKKINEMYHGDASYTGWNINWNRYKRELSDVERSKQIRWMESAKNWFKEEVFGGLNDFEMVVLNEEPQKQETELSESCESHLNNNNTVLETSPAVVQQPDNIKTVNKNAYEIREAILSHALSWIQYTHSLKCHTPVPTEDDVLNVAQKFYKFVENKR